VKTGKIDQSGVNRAERFLTERVWVEFKRFVIVIRYLRSFYVIRQRKRSRWRKIALDFGNSFEDFLNYERDAIRLRRGKELGCKTFI